MGDKLSLKLFIDPVSHKLIFAEAGKDFVDFLFGLLAIPMGAVIRLGQPKNIMPGCIVKIFNSFKSLEGYLQTSPSSDPEENSNKITSALDSLIITPNSHIPSLLLQPSSFLSATNKYYTCHCYHRSFSDIYGASCSRCSKPMTTDAKFDRAGNENPGMVKSAANYVVMDDLSVMLLSSMNIIILLSMFDIKDMTALEQKTVEVGFDEGVAILKASLQSKTILSDLFLPKLNVKKDEQDVKKIDVKQEMKCIVKKENENVTEK